MIVRTQAEWDALPNRFDEHTVIEIRSAPETWVTISRVPENSSVVARGSSRVVARESSSVVARESSRVEARESSRVEAWGRVTVHQYSRTNPELHGQAACFLYDGAGVPLRKSERATIIQVQPRAPGVAGWLEEESVTEADGFVILYKRVSADFKTQEGRPNETLWALGSVLEHPAWSREKAECEGGKYHAVPRPYFADEFRSEFMNDRYIAIRVAVGDLFAWDDNPQYPHKIAVRRAEVLYECDQWGDKITQPVAEVVL